MDVVLIHLGSRPPRYLRACTRQVEKVAGAPPVLVGPLRGARYRGEKLRRFRATEGLTELGLGGFWRYAAERFFVLEEHMRKTGLERCLHIESDCLLYVAPSAYEGWLSDVYGDSVATCPLTDDQDTAAAMYVGSLQALSAFNLALLRLVALGRPERLLELHGGEMGNEMRMIRLLRDAGLARALPVTVAQAKALGSPIIFDPASYGQFVDGTPGAPGVPYAGEHHQAGRELIGGHCQILWNTQRQVPIVFARGESGEYPLANLHVHSKRLERWVTEPQPQPEAAPTARVGDPARALVGEGLGRFGRSLRRRAFWHR